MAEAIIIGGGGGGSSGSSGPKATIRVFSNAGAIVACTKEGYNFTKRSPGTVDFEVKYGTWTITTTVLGVTKVDTIEVDIATIYTFDHNVANIYGIEIDMDNLDPTTAVSYIGDAEGFTPLYCATGTGICNYGSWEDIITNKLGIKPCLYLNGNRSVYLNPNNYAQNISGTAVDITSGSAGDVMVEFASRWYKYSKEGNKLRFEVSDTTTEDLSGGGFVKTAFLSEEGSAIQRDYFYYSAYEGSVISNKLRSLSGKSPTVSTSYDSFITAASATGVKYTIEAFAKRMYILGLLMLVTKSRDGQATVGRGIIGSSGSLINTGTMNTSGLFFGRPDVDTSGVKVFGIENFWGNIYKFMAGLVTMNTTGTLGIKNCAPYSPAGTGYMSVTTGWGIGNAYPKVNTPYMNGSIILPSEKQSDVTKCWPDYFYVDSAVSRVAFVGGSWGNALEYSGPFYCVVVRTSSDTSAYIGSRLVSS